jgi:hypothetical protein
MDEKHRSILEGLPNKSPRSRLEPYQELIIELRQRGRTYREIERIPVDQCQVRVSRSTINDLVRVHLRKEKKSPKCPRLSVISTDRVKKANRANPEDVTSDEVYRRIAELKQRPVATQTIPKLFHYDPDEPLHLIQEKTRE